MAINVVLSIILAIFCTIGAFCHHDNHSKCSSHYHHYHLADRSAAISPQCLVSTTTTLPQDPSSTTPFPFDPLPPDSFDDFHCCTCRQSVTDDDPSTFACSSCDRVYHVDCHVPPVEQDKRTSIDACILCDRKRKKTRPFYRHFDVDQHLGVHATKIGLCTLQTLLLKGSICQSERKTGLKNIEKKLLDAGFHSVDNLFAEMIALFLTDDSDDQWARKVVEHFREIQIAAAN